MNIKSLMLVILMAVFPLACYSQIVTGTEEVLYGISDGHTGTQYGNNIYQIDATTGEISEAHQLHYIPGTGANTITNPKGMEWRDGIFWVVARTLSVPNVVRYELMTVDPATGICTRAGIIVTAFGAEPSSYNIKSVAFGKSRRLLYGITDVEGADPETLYEIDIASGGPTFLFSAEIGGALWGGEAIAFEPGGRLYRANGGCPIFFQEINVYTQTIYQLGSECTTEATALGYSVGRSKMFLSDKSAGTNGNLYTVDLHTGARTLVAPITGQQVAGADNRALVFVPVSAIDN